MKTIWSGSRKGRGSCDRMCSILPMSRSLCNLLLMFTPIISACESVYIFSLAAFRHKMAVAGCCCWWWCHVVQALWSNRFQCLFKTCSPFGLGFFFFFYPFCIVRGRGISELSSAIFSFNNHSCTTWTNYNMEKVDLWVELSACFFFCSSSACKWENVFRKLDCRKDRNNKSCAVLHAQTSCWQ